MRIIFLDHKKEYQKIVICAQTVLTPEEETPIQQSWSKRFLTLNDIDKLMDVDGKVAPGRYQ